MLTVSAAARHDLSDAQWALLEPLLPPTAPCGRPRRWPIRGLVDGVRHRARAGCPWRDVPVRYGPWWRVYALFACWQLLGVWARVEAALSQAADRNGRLSWQVSVDSTGGYQMVCVREGVTDLKEFDCEHDQGSEDGRCRA